jgi:hypothetical protein
MAGKKVSDICELSGKKLILNVEFVISVAVTRCRALAMLARPAQILASSISFGSGNRS